MSERDDSQYIDLSVNLGSSDGSEDEQDDKIESHKDSDKWMDMEEPATDTSKKSSEDEDSTVITKSDNMGRNQLLASKEMNRSLVDTSVVYEQKSRGHDYSDPNQHVIVEEGAAEFGTRLARRDAAKRKQIRDSRLAATPNWWSQNLATFLIRFKKRLHIPIVSLWLVLLYICFLASLTIYLIYLFVNKSQKVPASSLRVVDVALVATIGFGSLPTLLILLWLLSWPFKRFIAPTGLAHYYTNMRTALVFVVWGAIMLLVNIAVDSRATSKDTIAQLILWLFLVTLLGGIAAMIRFTVEEIIHRKLHITTASPQLKIALIKEYYLHQLLEYGRNHNIIPPKNSDEENLKDVDVRMQTKQEFLMLRAVRKLRSDYQAEIHFFGKAIEPNKRRAIFDIMSKMFEFLDTDRKGFLTEEDFVTIFPHDSEVAFLVFDQELYGRITLEAFAVAVEEIYLNRRATIRTFNDRYQIGLHLRTITSACFWILIFLFAVFLISAYVSFDLSLVGAAVLAVAFLFTPPFKELISCFIFLLIVDPYAVGDHVIIGSYRQAITGIFDDRGPGKERYPILEVQKIQLYRTIFLSTDGQYHSLSNAEISQLDVVNWHRSDDYTVKSELSLESDVDVGKVIGFKEAIEDFVVSHPETFRDDSAIWVQELEGPNKVYIITLWIPLNGIGWHNRWDWVTVRMELFLFIKKTAQDLHIDYRIQNSSDMSKTDEEMILKRQRSSPNDNRIRSNNTTVIRKRTTKSHSISESDSNSSNYPW